MPTLGRCCLGSSYLFISALVFVGTVAGEMPLGYLSEGRTLCTLLIAVTEAHANAMDLPFHGRVLFQASTNTIANLCKGGLVPAKYISRGVSISDSPKGLPFPTSPLTPLRAKEEYLISVRN